MRLLTSHNHGLMLPRMKQITIRLPDELHKKLGHYCVDTDKSANQIILEFLERLLKEGNKQKK